MSFKKVIRLHLKHKTKVICWQKSDLKFQSLNTYKKMTARRRRNFLLFLSFKVCYLTKKIIKSVWKLISVSVFRRWHFRVSVFFRLNFDRFPFTYPSISSNFSVFRRGKGKKWANFRISVLFRNPLGPPSKTVMSKIVI